MLLQACNKRPAEAIIGKWEVREADHKRGNWEFFADGRCTGHSVESWGPSDTATISIAGDSIWFTTDRPVFPPGRRCYRIVFENNDKFTLEPQFTELPTWYQRVHD